MCAEPRRKKQKTEEAVSTLNFLDVESEVTIWRPQKSRRGKIKCPEKFPRFEAKSIMFVILSTIELMEALYEAMRGMQQEFWADIKSFQGSMCQGEFSKTGMAHLQGVVNFKTTVKSTALFNKFAPYLQVAFGLQVEKANSRKDAWHYCSKPHNMCSCHNCEKARKCKPNWTLPAICGNEPVGRGQKFVEFERAIKVNPTKKVMIEEFGSLYCRYSKGMNDIRQYYQFKKAAAEYKVRGLDFLDCYQLAESINVAYNSDPSRNRDITWIWSSRLNTGKTVMANFMKMLIGFDKCIDGIKSLKHYITAYEGEVFTHFNFEKKGPPSADALKVIESCDDGGFRQGAMYKAPKKVIATKVVVTANHPPPYMWIDPAQKRVCREIRLDPYGTATPPVWYNAEWPQIPIDPPYVHPMFR